MNMASGKCTGSKRNKALFGVRGLRSMGVSLALLSLAGCGSVGDSQVLGAVFGLETAETKPFQLGKIPEPEARPEDSVIGQAASAPGACIWRRGTSNRRFQAPCPEGYEL